MARAQFDRNDILDKSIQLFWKNGFSASSMQQVVKATGLKPGSIYLAFGNKEGLFREALNSYAKKTIAQIHSTLLLNIELLKNYAIIIGVQYRLLIIIVTTQPILKLC